MNSNRISRNIFTQNCIIIDDEPLARTGLKEYVEEIDFFNLLEAFNSALAASDIIASGNVQLIFMDIQMPKITGLDFYKTSSNPPAVIFTTAYPLYVPEGFEVSALDYLEKPVSFDRFYKAALKAREQLQLKEAAPKVTQTTDHFFIKTDNKLIKIMLDDLLFAEARQNYVALYTAQQKYTSYLTMQAVGAFLPAGRFIKVHKSSSLLRIK